MKPNENLKPYFTLHLWTEKHPYEFVRTRGSKFAVIREMNVVKHPDWKPEIIPGGFVGHCTNQDQQKWLYESDPDGYEIEVRWSQPKQAWYDKNGARYTNESEPEYYYDYNF